jgi:alpha-L-fucosidase
MTTRIFSRLLPVAAVAVLFIQPLLAVEPLKPTEAGNKAERLEWFRDLGFGMFIHWSVDSQTGAGISHSLVGADEAYQDKFFNDLPKTFNPTRLDTTEWAALAKLAGMKYVLFTAKHHSGFCMWDTDTTPFGIKHTPYKKDITRDVFDAFRAQGIAAGVYFSTEDFLWLRENKLRIERATKVVEPRNQPGLMKLAQTQLTELLGNYGKIDLLFLDGSPIGLRDLGWKMNPDLVVTRGGIETPEQFVPGVAPEGAWESNLTMGTSWQYKPTNESYKSGGDLISTLVETRAKGGNLLLNVGPKPTGDPRIRNPKLLVSYLSSLR